MEVSKVSDQVESALVASGQSQAFTFAQTPEAFKVFFASLYKNPLYAMVREALCNAWDSHIANGTTSTPIKVTIDEGHLVIEDSGTGIPHAKMGEVYCTIGNSTKKNDGRQTGGFGYGCKSPYAYTDNFEVTAYHGGVRTIYRMLRSDPNKDGFPSFTPIVSLPTVRTGLTLRIPVPENTIRNIHSIIREVVFLGSISCDMDGEILPMLDMSMEENSFAFVPQYATGMTNTRSIYVRYGNVVYPLSDHEEYREDFELVEDLLDHVSGRCNYNLILQAKPDSLAITPSREEMSMQDITVKAVQGLFDEFFAKVPEDLDKEIKAVTDVLYAERKELPIFEEIYQANIALALTPDLSREWNSAPDSNNVSFRHLALSSVLAESRITYKFFHPYIEDLCSRIEALPPQERQMYTSWSDEVKRLMGKSSRTRTRHYIPSGFNVSVRNMVQGLWKKAVIAHINDEDLSKRPLLMMSLRQAVSEPSDARPPYLEIRKLNNVVNPTGALKKTILLTFTKQNTFEIAGARLRQLYGKDFRPEGVLVQVLHKRSREAVKHAVETYTHAGYHVEDLTVSKEADPHHVKKIFVERAEVQKKAEITRLVNKGDAPIFNKQGHVLALSNLLDAQGKVDVTTYRKRAYPAYVAKPKAIVQIALNKDTPKATIKCEATGTVFSSIVADLAEVYGNEVGIVMTQPQYLKAKTEMTFSELVAKDTDAYIKKSAWFKARAAHAVSRIHVMDIRDWPFYTRVLQRMVDGDKTFLYLFDVKKVERPEREQSPIANIAKYRMDTDTSKVYDQMKKSAKPYPFIDRLVKKWKKCVPVQDGVISVYIDTMASIQNKETLECNRRVLRALAKITKE
ncbi:histidine kinase-like ATPase [Vibrio phage 1.261.O._10N.286.51.A7]|uniref:Histidine kinase-like ATPase n=1 Tax=Vibrio phage 1.261.O._10N.286.51.A7 TaxID=1881237 RepID=A0A2I7RZE3_9CAUD|nr:RIIA lysis inhibitor [Vibrio phage 1.261.O._10N.286.51.A7]AUR99029.1 histidine kinase-like ATPase [Vibrio phage 1.261.O._10N.286.51.A7]